jgi:hypothetical protein
MAVFMSQRRKVQQFSGKLEEFSETKMINSDSALLNSIPVLVIITHLQTKTWH